MRASAHYAWWMIGALALAAPPARSGHRGATGALLLGLVFGVALGPCTFAFMAPLLGIAFHASGTGGAARGVLLVALYGLGHAAAIALASLALVAGCPSDKTDATNTNPTTPKLTLTRTAATITANGTSSSVTLPDLMQAVQTLM